MCRSEFQFIFILFSQEDLLSLSSYWNKSLARSNILLENNAHAFKTSCQLLAKSIEWTFQLETKIWFGKSSNLEIMLQTINKHQQIIKFFSLYFIFQNKDPCTFKLIWFNPGSLSVYERVIRMIDNIHVLFWFQWLAWWIPWAALDEVLWELCQHLMSMSPKLPS